LHLILPRCDAVILGSIVRRNVEYMRIALILLINSECAS